MEYEQWLGILTSINADNDLNESNVIEKIKEKLEKEDPGTYKERQDNQFDINYTLLDSLGELEVRLYPDMRNKDLMRVEVRDQEMLKQLKDCEEKIGKNCLLGELPFNQAIEQGFFVRSGKLMRSEAMSQSNGQKKGSWCERISRASNSEQTTSCAMR